MKCFTTIKILIKYGFSYIYKKEYTLSMSTTKNENDQTWISKAYGRRDGLNLNDTYYDDDKFLVGTVEHVGRVAIVGMTAEIVLTGGYAGNLPSKYLIIDTHGTLLSIHPSKMELE